VQLKAVQGQIDALERRLCVEHRTNETSRRLKTIPGIGVIGATAIVGLVPRQSSTGGKVRLAGISKQGDRYLRRLFVIGAMAVVKQARAHPDKHPWLIQLLARRPAKVVAVALANKMARTAWAVLARGESYRAPAFLSAA